MDPAFIVLILVVTLVIAIAILNAVQKDVTPDLPGVAASDQCPTCGYDQRAATSDRCPECGTVTPRFRRVGLDLAKLAQVWPAESIEPPTTPAGTAAATLFVAPSAIIAELSVDQLRARGIDARQTIVRSLQRSIAYGVYETHHVPLGVDVPATDVERAEAILAHFACD